MLNQALLIGHTGAEPEIRTTQGGKAYASLRIATNRYSKKGGEKKGYTTWHTVEIWDAPMVNWLASKTLPKGSKVFVQGEIRHDQFTDKYGVERYFSKVVIVGPGHELKALDRPEQPSAPRASATRSTRPAGGAFDASMEGSGELAQVERRDLLADTADMSAIRAEHSDVEPHPQF
jgi:single-strand DNA-binding protein